MPFLGGIEAGGTKFSCAVGTGPDDVRAQTTFPTTTPEETLARAVDFFRGQAVRHPIAAIGIASFGPVDVAPGSPTFGFITNTPKPNWTHTNFAGTVGRALGVPVGFDTDVNGAARAEHRWGAARGLDTFAYWTIGTGVGGGGLANGKPLHGLTHPEMGHMRIPHDWEDDPFPGCCPFHGDCLEGMASGQAIEARWGARGETLPPDHPAWKLEAHYLALGLVNAIAVLSPQRIILGGGVMQQAQIFSLVREQVQTILADYVQVPLILESIENYVVPPELGSQAGVLGAIALAQDAKSVLVENQVLLTQASALMRGA